MTVHDFRRSLQESQRHADAPWWEQVYREAFPTFEGMTYVAGLGSGQRDGIDRILTLASGRTVAVDEKVRALDYDDFCLEYWSVKHKTNASKDEPGWVAKDLRCDYLAYAFVPSGRCYLLPFHDLRRAWRSNHEQWVRTHRRVEADNGHYVTVSVAVPIVEVLQALSDATLVHFEAEAVAA